MLLLVTKKVMSVFAAAPVDNNARTVIQNAPCFICPAPWLVFVAVMIAAVSDSRRTFSPIGPDHGNRTKTSPPKDGLLFRVRDPVDFGTFLRAQLPARCRNIRIDLLRLGGAGNDAA